MKNLITSCSILYIIINVGYSLPITNGPSFHQQPGIVIATVSLIVGVLLTILCVCTSKAEKQEACKPDVSQEVAEEHRVSRALPDLPDDLQDVEGSETYDTIAKVTSPVSPSSTLSVSVNQAPPPPPSPRNCSPAAPSSIPSPSSVPSPLPTTATPAALLPSPPGGDLYAEVSPLSARQMAAHRSLDSTSPLEGAVVDGVYIDSSIMPLYSEIGVVDLAETHMLAPGETRARQTSDCTATGPTSPLTSASPLNSTSATVVRHESSAYAEIDRSTSTPVSATTNSRPTSSSLYAEIRDGTGEHTSLIRGAVERHSTSGYCRIGVTTRRSPAVRTSTLSSCDHGEYSAIRRLEHGRRPPAAGGTGGEHTTRRHSTSTSVELQAANGSRSYRLSTTTAPSSTPAYAEITSGNASSVYAEIDSRPNTTATTSCTPSSRLPLDHRSSHRSNDDDAEEDDQLYARVQDSHIDTRPASDLYAEIESRPILMQTLNGGGGGDGGVGGTGGDSSPSSPHHHQPQQQQQTREGPRYSVLSARESLASLRQRGAIHTPTSSSNHQSLYHEITEDSQNNDNDRVQQSHADENSNTKNGPVNDQEVYALPCRKKASSPGSPRKRISEAKKAFFSDSKSPETAGPSSSTNINGGCSSSFFHSKINSAAPANPADLYAEIENALPAEPIYQEI